MGEEKERVNLWEQTGNKCLECALELLNSKTALDMDKARTVGKLVETAISIDTLNLRWAEQNRYAGAVFRGHALEQKVKEN